MEKEQKKINSRVSEALSLLNSATKSEIEMGKNLVNDKTRQALSFLSDQKETGIKQLEEGLERSKEKIREEPVKSTLIAMLVGLVLGFLLNSRRRG